LSLLKTAVVLVRTDGTISVRERKALDECAEVMEMTEELPGIETEMADFELSPDAGAREGARSGSRTHRRGDS